ncbi:hypothetical protein [Sphingomonas sp. ERG5]|uniref:hypothetical protein n=1 Tax=Sphingomonas sp. ERG5 TaxID=1381597 RepID=UPI00054C3D9C|nr:hypothetical protein [Sphingomonas sp. ERG5]
MAKSNFMFRVPGCDIQDVDGCRNKLIDIFRDPEFDTFVRSFQANLATASTAPAPRGGEASLSGKADSNGGWSVEGKISITF